MKISIITTFYNSVKLGDFVKKSMECLLNQTYRNIEFICVNDGSTDDTFLQLSEYAQEDKRIILVNKENEGVAQYAKAAGQDIASGDFIMLFDHDDILSLDAIEKAVDSLLKDENLDAISFIVKTQYLDGRVKNILNLNKLIKDFSSFQPQYLTGDEMFKLTVGRYDVHFRGLIKKDKFKAVSFRYSEKLVNGDEIIERLIFKNLNLVSSCDGIYYHYIYENSSAKSFNLKKTDFVRTDVVLRNIFKNHKVYEDRKNIFELAAYKNLITAIKAYHHFTKKMNKSEKKFFYLRLKEGFDKLDKKCILKQYNKNYIRIYNSLLLNNFFVLINFYNIKRN